MVVDMMRGIAGLSGGSMKMAEAGDATAGQAGGGDAGAAQGTAAADMFEGKGDAGAGGGEAEGGALAGGTADDSAVDGIDWDSITDDEYFAKVKYPEIEGVTIGTEYIKKNYGEFIRKHHISPEALADYMKMEGANFKKAYDESVSRQKAESDEIRKNFEAQGEELKKTYNPQQIDTAVRALSEFADDKDFMKIATTNLSNNKTLVKLLLNWADRNSVDDTAGAGSGTGGSSLSGFAERWTGRKM